jgi:Pyruvate/2-oxoacid:ferredoxin oxidoreductase delta subunit
MSLEIYYFSGTGNSLFAAKELQKLIPEAELIPVVSLLNKKVIETKGETVGFVFPLHLTTVPVPVREFLKKLDLKQTKYIFSLITRTGTFSLADIHIKKILKKKGKALNSSFILNMPDNSPTGLKPGQGNKNWINHITDEKILKLDSEAKSNLEIFQKIIINKEKYPENNSPFIKYFLEFIISLLTEKSNTILNFYYYSTCSGCGICEKVCPSARVKMVDGKPLWQKDVKCFYCYACFNYCPSQSILLKNYTDKSGRYFHPGITVNDIAGQKS